MAERPTRPLGLRLRPTEHRTLLFFGDLIAAILADVGAYYTWLGYAWYKLISSGIPPLRAIKFFPSADVPVWFYFLPILWIIFMVEIYDSHTAAHRGRTLRGIAVAAVLGLALYSLIFITNRDPESLPRILVGAFLLFASLLTLGWRMLYIRFYTSSGLQRRILVVGAGKAGRTLARLYKSMSPPPFHFVGFIDDDREKIGKSFEGFPVFGNSEQLLQTLEEQHISDIIIGIMGVMRGVTFQRILDAQEDGVEIIPMPTLYEEMTGRVPIQHLESDWLIRSFVDQARVSGFYELFKRVVDILGGLAGMAIFLFVYPFIALAILIDSGKPIFYSQSRLGKSGSLFVIRKFRTMHQNAEADGKARLATENDPRITRVGNFLRKTRLDELPQFWNVVRGEMSLVGPRAERPELVAEFQRQIPFYRARLLVKPGLTGWAQINYGYVASVTETAVKLEYDLYYIKHRTLTMDVQIILRTIGTVARGAGR
ncbi:MAG: sugar transferase [Anaerolineaceae bacterium]|nr:MAG: sugar transferase [Anaerolineaceae bacterium]